jgi:hypothetical protein
MNFDNYKERILFITKNINVCDIGVNKLCNSPMPWRKPGVGCCHECKYHTQNGCSTENLICMAWYCDYIQKKIDPNTISELHAIIKELSMKCLKVRQSKETQIELLTKYNLKKK